MAPSPIRIEDVKVRRAPPRSMPTEFDFCARHSWAQQPSNQGLCGACWAITPTQTLRDRLNLYRESKGRAPAVPELSFQTVIDCASNCISYRGRSGCALSCHGGFLVTGYRYLRDEGTTRELFWPNRGDDADGDLHLDAPAAAPAASKRCPVIPAAEPRFRCDSFYIVNLYDTFGETNARSQDSRMDPRQLAMNEDNIRREIHERGPVSVCFNLFSDFRPFWRHPRSGEMVYQLGWAMSRADRDRLDPIGSTSWSEKRPGPGGLHFVTGHSVSIVGWGSQPGEDGPVPYWICRNSWGRPARTYRGGFFKIRRSINCSAIEADVAACWFDPHRTPLTPSGACNIANPISYAVGPPPPPPPLSRSGAQQHQRQRQEEWMVPVLAALIVLTIAWLMS